MNQSPTDNANLDQGSPPMTKHLQLVSVLEEICAEVPDVRAAVLASRDGLAIASTMDSTEGSRIAAMAATVHAVSHRVASTAELGEVQETVVRASSMTFVVYDAGVSAVLAVLADGDCNLGLVHLESRRTAADLQEHLSSRATPPPPPPAPRPVASAEPTSVSGPAPGSAKPTEDEGAGARDGGDDVAPAADRPSAAPSPNGQGHPDAQHSPA